MGLSEPSVLVIGTLDTKGPEVAYLRSRLHALGLPTIVMDTGILGEPLDIAPDVSHEDLAHVGGTTIDALREAGTRGRAVEQMRTFVRSKVKDFYDNGMVLGAIGLGGAEGAVMAASALMELPLGVPKMVLSPIASGRHLFDPLVGTSDMLVMHTVVDILGLNEIARTVFDNAAAAMAGMVQHGRTGLAAPDDVRSIAITMLGNTTTSSMAMREVLAEAGYDGVVFHANGVGGPAMEELVAAGHFLGVIDLTLSEMVGNVMGGVHVGGEGRMRAAATSGVPQVIVPGCVEFAVFPPHSIPEVLSDRPVYDHNPEFALVRADRAEMLRIADDIATRVNEATGPVVVVVPMGGFSIPNVPGGVFYDPQTDAAFLERLCSMLRPDIPVIREDLHVNDPEFGRRVGHHFLALLDVSPSIDQPRKEKQ
jgi:uncharacterized protein (UPF0261 family)